MRLYTRRETAEKLGVGLTTLDKLRKNGSLGYYQAIPGGKVLFTQRHVDEFLDRAERKPKRVYRTNNKR